MLASNASIEFATAADALEISKLSRKLVEFNLPGTYTPQRIVYLVKHSSTNVIVARKDHALLGFGIMRYREDSANLDLLAVKKPCHRRGVGTQLVRWLEKVAHTAGVINIFVQVRKTNGAALRFYQALGFHLLEEVPGYYHGRETALILCKGIRPMVGDLLQLTSPGGRDRVG